MGARNALATVRLAEGSYDMAIEQAEMAFRMNSRNIRAVRILGEAYLRKGEVSRAKRIYEAIVEQIPQDAPSHYSLGLIARAIKMKRELLLILKRHWRAIRNLSKP